MSLAAKRSALGSEDSALRLNKKVAQSRYDKPVLPAGQDFTDHARCRRTRFSRTINYSLSPIGRHADE